MLYEAAMAARLGRLDKRADMSGLLNTANMLSGELHKWYNGPDCGNGFKAVSAQQIAAVGTALNDALGKAAQNCGGVPVFEYSQEKNNPYRKNAQGYVPVSKVYISYTPCRKDGAQSRYPWLVQVENFEAPLSERKNGATAHDARNAVNKTAASINLSADDFSAAMVSVERFVRLWEMAEALPVVRQAYKKLEAIRNQN